jgi:hypothetical protein
MSLIPASSRAMSIEYAIRDVVVPATKLENEGHDIIKLNIGDPIAYPGLGTPKHMIDAYVSALISGNNGYSPSYGLPKLRAAIAEDESLKPCRFCFQQYLLRGIEFLRLALIILHIWHIPRWLEQLQRSTD